jgi:hypothetical protein
VRDGGEEVRDGEVRHLSGTRDHFGALVEPELASDTPLATVADPATDSAGAGIIRVPTPVPATSEIIDAQSCAACAPSASADPVIADGNSEEAVVSENFEVSDILA